MCSIICPECGCETTEIRITATGRKLCDYCYVTSKGVDYE